MLPLLLGAVLLLILVFGVLVSFHDAPNGTAMAVRGHALTPRVAVGLSAVFTVIGFLAGIPVLAPVADRWLQVPPSTTGLGVLLAVLVAVILWELLTWWFRMPSSSTHATVGGLLGALWACEAVGLGTSMDEVLGLVARLWVPLLLGPLLSFALSRLAVFLVVRAVRHTSPRRVTRGSQYVLALGTSVTALSHGVYFGHRLLLLAVVALACGGIGLAGPALWWAVFAISAVMALGTLGGGWRIARTIAEGLVTIDAFRGAVAMAVSSLLAFGTGVLLRDPYSSSHLVASAVFGAGTQQRFKTVRTRTAIRLAATWLLTLPVCAVVAAVLMLAVSPLFQ